MDELDSRKIISKSGQPTKKLNGGGVPFTYGSLPYLLKNRVYIGEMGQKLT